MKHVTENFYYVLCVTCYVFIDQVTKLFFWSRDFFIGLLHIHPIKNYGLSFAVNLGAVANILFITIALAYFVYYFFSQFARLSNFQKTSFGLIFAGAISNIVDRIILGFVRDFLDIGLGFTFNLADAMILSGLIGIFLFNTPIAKNSPQYKIDID